MSVEEARASGDQVIHEMADGLDDSGRIFDARPGRKLRGFPRLAIDGIRKHNAAPVFALNIVEAPRMRPWWKLW
jgi:hypothetical protein